jgi:hypothetical protein
MAKNGASGNPHSPSSLQDGKGSDGADVRGHWELVADALDWAIAESPACTCAGPGSTDALCLACLLKEARQSLYKLALLSFVEAGVVDGLARRGLALTQECLEVSAELLRTNGATALVSAGRLGVGEMARELHAVVRQATRGAQTVPDGGRGKARGNGTGRKGAKGSGQTGKE